VRETAQEHIMRIGKMVDESRNKGKKQMTSDTPLFIIIMGLLGLTAYLLATAPKITAQERKEMEEDWWE
jgi:hypothetical protein